MGKVPCPDAYEACIETTDVSVVREATSFIRELCGDPVTKEYAKSLVSLYPADGERMFGTPGKRAPSKGDAPRSKIWVAPVTDSDWDEAVKRTDKREKSIASDAIADPKKSKLNKIWWDSKVSFAEGDWLVQRSSKGSGFIFAVPGRVIRISAVDSTSGHIVYLEQPRSNRDIASAEIRSTLGESSAAVLYKDANTRLVRSAATAVTLQRLWPAFRA